MVACTKYYYANIFTIFFWLKNAQKNCYTFRETVYNAKNNYVKDLTYLLRELNQQLRVETGFLSGTYSYYKELVCKYILFLNSLYSHQTWNGSNQKQASIHDRLGYFSIWYWGQGSIVKVCVVAIAICYVSSICFHWLGCWL